MEYKIEVNEILDGILKSNAARYGKSVPDLIAELLSRYLIDAHIMEQGKLWEDGINECAEINLDWANL